MAQQQGKLCGFVLSYDWFNFVRAKATRNIDLLFVVPSCRKAGAGRMLMAAVAQDAVAKSITRMVVTAVPGNQEALKFYQKLGLSKEYKKSMRFPMDSNMIAALARLAE